MKTITDIFLSQAASVLGDTNKGLSGSVIVESLVSYANDSEIHIPHSSSPFDAPNKRTALLENLRAFQGKDQYKIIRDLCDHPKLPKPIDISINNLKIQLIARYGNEFGSASAETLNMSLVNETEHWLADYETSLVLYQQALLKFNNSIFKRNLLDDLRLSLESLLNNILDNDKSLENQISNLGSFINQNGGSKQFTNMFHKLVDYYANYQNTFVKHDDAVIEEEIEFIFEMTSSFMKHIVKIYLKSK